MTIFYNFIIVSTVYDTCFGFIGFYFISFNTLFKSFALANYFVNFLVVEIEEKSLIFNFLELSPISSNLLLNDFFSYLMLLTSWFSVLLT